MTLGDAIRKGAMQREQCRGLIKLRAGEVIATCALAAAYEGVFGVPPNDPDTDAVLTALKPIYPELLESRCTPEPGWAPMPVISAITYLNDTRGWSRESIADWLDTLEA